MTCLALLPIALGASPRAQPWEATPLPGPLRSPATRQGLAEVNGIKLSFATYGQGEPVILLHGGAGNGEHWANQVPVLAQRFRVLLVDSRGHGRSTRDETPLSLELMADDVLSLLQLYHF